jgi:predicted esterase
MVELAKRLALPGMAYVAIAAAGSTWYPQSFLAPLADNQPQLDWALERLTQVMASLAVPRERLAILGFSQGACLACELAVRAPARYGALAILTGGWIGPPGLVRERAGSLGGTPVLMEIAEHDPWVPFVRAQETADLFRELGAEVDFHTRPGSEHVVTDAALAATRALLAPLVGQ